MFYNQSEWWRAANGYCLKCGGDTCHVAPRASAATRPSRRHRAGAARARRRGRAASARGARCDPAGRAVPRRRRAHLTLEPDELLAARRACRARRGRWRAATTRRACATRWTSRSPASPSRSRSKDGRVAGAARRRHRHQLASAAARWHRRARRRGVRTSARRARRQAGAQSRSCSRRPRTVRYRRRMLPALRSRQRSSTTCWAELGPALSAGESTDGAHRSSREQFSDQTFLWEIDAPDVAAAAEPGHFVMLRLARRRRAHPAHGRRLRPRARQRSRSSCRRSARRRARCATTIAEGDEFADFVGPLGLPQHIERRRPCRARRRRARRRAGLPATARVQAGRQPHHLHRRLSQPGPRVLARQARRMRRRTDRLHRRRQRRARRLRDRRARRTCSSASTPISSSRSARCR